MHICTHCTISTYVTLPCIFLCFSVNFCLAKANSYIKVTNESCTGLNIQPRDKQASDIYPMPMFCCLCETVKLTCKYQSGCTYATLFLRRGLTLSSFVQIISSFTRSANADLNHPNIFDGYYTSFRMMPITFMYTNLNIFREKTKAIGKCMLFRRVLQLSSIVDCVVSLILIGYLTLYLVSIIRVLFYRIGYGKLVWQAIATPVCSVLTKLLLYQTKLHNYQYMLLDSFSQMLTWIKE